jgi:hypothetical protein
MRFHLARPVRPHRAQCRAASGVPSGVSVGTGTNFRELRARRIVTGVGIIREVQMGRGILLWLLGVPIPVIILLALVWR